MKKQTKNACMRTACAIVSPTVKKVTHTILACLAIAATVHAGPYNTPKDVIPPPPNCFWTWYGGGSVGYLTGDCTDEMLTAHIGAEFDCRGKCTQSLFLEIGYTDIEKTVQHRWNDPECPDGWVDDYKHGDDNLFTLNLTAEIIPITLNYKYECELGGNWRWYVGAGAGIALVELDATDGYITESWDDTVFYAHFFLGVSVRITSKFELFGGVRYIYMADANLSGYSYIDMHITIYGVVLFELGGRYKF